MVWLLKGSVCASMAPLQLYLHGWCVYNPLFWNLTGNLGVLDMVFQRGLKLFNLSLAFLFCPVEISASSKPIAVYKIMGRKRNEIRQVRNGQTISGFRVYNKSTDGSLTLGGFVGSKVQLEANNIDGFLVLKKAYIGMEAEIYGEVRISGPVRIDGEVLIYDHASISGSSRILERAVVHGRAKVDENAVICGDARIFGNARVYGDANILGYAKVYDRAKVFGSVKILGASICGDAQVYGETRINGISYHSVSGDTSYSFKYITPSVALD